MRRFEEAQQDQCSTGYVFPGVLDSIFGMNFRICPQYNSFLFFCRNSRLKALKQLQRKRGTLLYGITLCPGKRLLGAGLLMALDVILKQQEPETELSPFYQHLRSKGEQKDSPQPGGQAGGKGQLLPKTEQHQILIVPSSRLLEHLQRVPKLQDCRCSSQHLRFLRDLLGHKGFFSHKSIEDLGLKPKFTYKPNSFHTSSPSYQ